MADQQPEPTPQPGMIPLEVEVVALERQRKEGHAREFTVYCDEGARIGGDNTAPPPLMYFLLSAGF